MDRFTFDHLDTVEQQEIFETLRRWSGEPQPPSLMTRFVAWVGNLLIVVGVKLRGLQADATGSRKTPSISAQPCFPEC